MKTQKPNQPNLFKLSLILCQICLIFLALNATAQSKTKAKSEEKSKVQRITNLEPATEHLLAACDVNYQKHTVVMNWTISGHSDESEMYWVERSVDKVVFDIIGSGSERKEIGKQKVNYSFVDKSPLKGVSYYRIICFENNQIKIVGDLIKVSDKTSQPNQNNYGVLGMERIHSVPSEKYNPHSIYQDINGYISMR